MNSCDLQETPADQTAAELQEGFVNLRSAFETNSEPTKLVQPRDGSFDYPTSYTQTAAVFGATPGNLATDTLFSQGLAMRIRIVGPIGLYQSRFALGVSNLTCNRRNLFDQWQQLRDIVVVGASENRRQRNALRIREEVVFAARTTAIGWVRSSFFPAPTARIEELSAMTREKSRHSAPRNSESNTWCSRRHTPRRCQYFSRRQHVIPEPQPISLGSISQGIPERNTNSMPVSTRRSSFGSRPLCRLRLRFFGSSGSMCAHNSSSINGFGIHVLPQHAMPHRTKTRINVQASFC
jgi:hypothetical protein